MYCVMMSSVTSCFSCAAICLFWSESRIEVRRSTYRESGRRRGRPAAGAEPAPLSGWLKMRDDRLRIEALGAGALDRRIVLEVELLFGRRSSPALRRP